MDIFECQRQAQEIGHDTATFDAHFPAGVFPCKWMDAYFGLFTVNAPGMDDGFVSVRQMNEAFPGFECKNLQSGK